MNQDVVNGFEIGQSARKANQVKSILQSEGSTNILFKVAENSHITSVQGVQNNKLHRTRTFCNISLHNYYIFQFVMTELLN